MYWPLLALGHVSLCLLPVLSCRPKEYATQDGQCCPMCHEGTVVIKHCTVDSGTRCGPCANGTYMNVPNGRTVCIHCTVCDSDRGLVAEKSCISTSNTVCDAKSGFFCKSLTENSCEVAQRHRVCTAGQRVKEPGTSRNDTTCEDCSEGYFSQSGINCTIWTVCSGTQVKVQPGSSKQDVVCGSASRSHYSLLIPCLGFVIALVLVVQPVFRKGQPT